MRLLSVLVLVLFPQCLLAQDSVKTINSEQVLAIVRTYHPVVKQAGIALEKRKAEIVQSRAAFDPVFNSYTARKTFNGQTYYDYQAPEVRIPTWYGIEVYSGMETLAGNRLDQSQTPGTSSYLGVQIPLAKNLLLDKRRAALQQAKLMHQLAQVQQLSVVNNLLMEAMEAYWAWVSSYQTYKVLHQQVETNKKRLKLVKQSYLLGERPAIDTVEALAQLQSFNYEKNEQWLQFQQAGLTLSAYLWNKEAQPYILPENVLPQDSWENEINLAAFKLNLEELLAAAAKNHPDLKQYSFKMESLTIDKRLKFQDLLPKVDLTYNHLYKGNNWWPANSSFPLFEQNYQYGLKLSIPLRLSEGRGAYKEARLKLEETRLEQSQSLQKVQLKVKAYYNEWLNLQNQTALQRDAYRNYQSLLQAEEIRFANGESSIFLINSRESKSLEALEKLIALKAKYFKTIYALQWSAGLLN